MKFSPRAPAPFDLFEFKRYLRDLGVIEHLEDFTPVAPMSVELIFDAECRLTDVRVEELRPTDGR